METLLLLTAKSLVQAIQNQANPSQAADAIDMRDKWLFEHDNGLLQMTPEVRLLLENASHPVNTKT